ncbi:hypothetical protein GC176_08965 [bacterium]|nr:hypothetical protein [bacterium]
MTGPVSSCHDDNLALLSGLGLLPPDSDANAKASAALAELAAAAIGISIEHLLLALWCEWRRVAPKRQRSRATKTAAWLQSVVDSGGCFTIGLAAAAGQRFADLCGRRVLFWPDGMPDARLASVVSSRIGRGEFARAAFVAKLNHVMQRVAEVGQTIVLADGTTGSDFVARAAQRAELPLLRVSCEERPRAADWLSRLMSADFATHPNEVLLFVSPSIAELSSDCAGRREKQSADRSTDRPLRDRLAIALADSIWCLSVRKNGNQHQLLQQRLTRPNCEPTAIRFVLTAEETVTDAVAELADQGAVVWRLMLPGAAKTDLGVSLSQPERQKLSHVTEAHAAALDLLRADLLRDDEWLIHWTRAMTRSLRDLPTDEWLDRQLRSSPDEPTGPLATLQQILREGIIRASSDGLRGSKPMTCFSAVPLRELVARRRFQTHRARWDFEPYGLCLRRRTLETLGARPVIYGDDSLWKALPEPERPWFQQRFSGRGKRRIDWSEELEWRIAGDVRLADFSRDDLIVFCRERSEVATLESLTDRPIVAVLGLLSDDVHH